MEFILRATKLHIPNLPAKWVQRPHLNKQLDEGLDFHRPVTLVSAPAGFGKTTCISSWLRQVDDWNTTWLSLDLSDDDPERFLQYLIATLQKVNQKVGKEILGVLNAGQLPPVEIISSILINDILSIGSQTILVLDDFHVIQDPFILRVFESLIANLPNQLHVILITREDPPLPLAKLRANGQLTEIRAMDLRFSHHDAEMFLKIVLELSLTQSDIAILDDKTEGWIAGLQLAGLSLRDRIDPSSFISSLSGNQRFILSYLTEQVLDRLTEETRNFLLQTSILDKFNGDLCNAVTGRTDCRTFLDQIVNANLFLVALDDDGYWYRYHHLFSDLLQGRQDQLFGDRTSDLHLRASRWYEQAGMASEAIQHALAAEDYALAVRLLEEHAMGMIMQGYAKTVNSWVHALPAAWRAQSPRTSLAFAWMYILQGAYTQAASYLERLEVDFEDLKLDETARRSIKAEWLIMKSLGKNMIGKMIESQTMSEEALKIIPKEDSRLKSLAYFSLASAYQANDDRDQAVEAYRLAIRHGKASNNTIAVMLSTSGLAQLAFDRGQLHLAFELAAPTCEQIERSDSLPPISTVVFGILGEIYYQWYQTELARSYYLRAQQLSLLGGYNSGTTNCWVLLSRLSYIEGNLEAAAGEIQKAVDLIKIETPEYVQQEVVAQQVCIYLAKNNPDAAEMALREKGFTFRERFSFPEFMPNQLLSHSSGLLYNSSIRFLLFKSRTGSNPLTLWDAIRLADKLIKGALNSQLIPIALETLLLRAQMHALLGDYPASRLDYLDAIDRAEPDGFIGVFIEQGLPVAEALMELHNQRQITRVRKEFIRRILTGFKKIYPDLDQPPAAKSQDGSDSSTLVEPLTDRELEVLRCMVEGLKYQEIAIKLFVSLNTVRYHIKAIYSKLHVHNRALATQKAQLLKILE